MNAAYNDMNNDITGNVPFRFHPSESVFPLDLQALAIGTISPLKSKLATFQYKEAKKLRTEVKLTVN